MVTSPDVSLVASISLMPGAGTVRSLEAFKGGLEVSIIYK